MHIYAPRRLARSHVPSGRSDSSYDRAPHTDAFIGGRVGGLRMIHQWEWSGCASDKRNDKGISDRWISPAAVKGAWKRCSHSSILVSKPPRLSPRLQPGAWHVHPHTHTIIFLQVRDSLTWWGGAHSVTCACILHGCCTHTEPHTNILSIDTIRGVEKLAHLVDIFIGTRSNLCKVSLLPVHWARTQ